MAYAKTPLQEWSYGKASTRGHPAHTNVIDGPTRLNVIAKEPMRFLLWTGKPLRQPVVTTALCHEHREADR